MRPQIIFFEFFILDKLKHTMGNSRRYDICIMDVQRASFAKHLRSQKVLESIKQIEFVIPEWLFHEPFEKLNNIPRKLFNPKPLKQIAKENNQSNDKQLNEELAKKMLNVYYSTEKASQFGFIITLDSHHTSHANSILTIKSSYPEIETRFVNNILREMATIYFRFSNHYKFKSQTKLSARFDKRMKIDWCKMKMNYSIIWVLIKIELSIIVIFLLLGFN